MKTCTKTAGRKEKGSEEQPPCRQSNSVWAPRPTVPPGCRSDPRSIKNEAAGSDHHCDLGLRLSFHRKICSNASPSHTHTARQATGQPRCSQRTELGKSHIFIQKFRVEERQSWTCTQHFTLREKKSSNDPLKKL